MTGLRNRNRRRRIGLILDAASQLFAQEGYEATRIEEIAHLANVSPATVYNYFTTKANILTALAIQHARRSLPARRAFLLDPPEDVSAAVQAFELLLADQAMKTLGKEAWRMIFAAPYTQPNSPLHRAGRLFGRLILRHYIKLLREFQERGQVRADADIPVLAELTAVLGTHLFGRFIVSETMTMDAMKAEIADYVRQSLVGALPEPRSGPLR